MTDETGNVDFEDKKQETSSKMELMEHLSELRGRLIRSLIYIILGAVIGWIFYSIFFRLLSSPISPYLEEHGSMFLLTGVAEGFTVKVQVSVLVGLILAAPLVTIEGWRFISPGLTYKERHGFILAAPLSVLLFVCGVVSSYYIMPAGIKWLLSQNPPDAQFMPKVQDTLLFILKMCLSFGVVFQMPVVLMFLAKVGLIDSAVLKSYWRHAVVLIAIAAALITPSADAFTMVLLCAPMIFLYIVSIGLVRMMEMD